MCGWHLGGERVSDGLRCGGVPCPRIRGLFPGIQQLHPRRSAPDPPAHFAPPGPPPPFFYSPPLQPPAHIAPVWYFTPFYSMLRAITSEMMYALIACVLAGAGLAVLRACLPRFIKAGIVAAAAVTVALMLSMDAKFWGVVVMGGSVIILFFLPWLDYSPVKSIRYRPGWHKYLYGLFVIDFLVLGYLGVQPPSPSGERVSQLGTLFYFGFFLLMPWWSRIGEVKPVPDRVTYVAH